MPCRGQSGVRVACSALPRQSTPSPVTARHFLGPPLIPSLQGSGGTQGWVPRMKAPGPAGRAASGGRVAGEGRLGTGIRGAGRGDGLLQRRMHPEGHGMARNVSEPQTIDHTQTELTILLGECIHTQGVPPAGRLGGRVAGEGGLVPALRSRPRWRRCWAGVKSGRTSGRSSAACIQSFLLFAAQVHVLRRRRPAVRVAQQRHHFAHRPEELRGAHHAAGPPGRTCTHQHHRSLNHANILHAPVPSCLNHANISCHVAGAW